MILNIISLILTVLGLISTYYFYLKAKRTLLLDVAIEYQSWYTLPNASLKLFYDKKQFDQIIFTNIILSNKGSVTIFNRDISLMKPWRIVSGCKSSIINYRLMSSKANVKIKKRKNELAIDVDYINPGGDVYISLISSGSDPLSFVGDIIDGKIFYGKQIADREFIYIISFFLVIGIISLFAFFAPEPYKNPMIFMNFIICYSYYLVSYYRLVFCER